MKGMRMGRPWLRLLLAAWAGVGGVGCSTAADVEYDAGSLPDAFFDDGDVSSPRVGDAGSPPVPDGGGDVTVSASPDASPSGDAAGDSAFDAPSDAGLDVATLAGDASDARAPVDGGDSSVTIDASDDLPPDASDEASSADASDASIGLDASDAGAASPDAGASDGSPGDGSPFDAAALCAAFNSASDPIAGVGAFDAAQPIEEDSVPTGYIAGSGVASPGDAVTVDAWTAPLGIMADLYVAYTTDGFQTTVQVPLASAGVTDAGPAPGSEAWSGTIAAQGHGVDVVWYVAGHDVCTGTVHYFSNSGNNYEYTAE